MPTPDAVTRWAPLALLIVGVALYVNTLDNQFVLDDEPSIVRNEAIRSSAAAAEVVLSSLFSFTPPDSRPLITATFAWNYAVDGLDPRGYHLVNLSIHVAAALALFGLVRRTLRLPRWGGRFDGRAAPLAFAVALLWLAHPLNTQAVTYVVQRGESMMAMFFLLAMYAAVRQWEAATPGARAGWTAACVLAALLGSWCKQVIVVLPLVVAAYDWVMLSPASWREGLRRRAVLYVGLTLVSALLVLRSLGAATQEDASAGFGMPVVTPLGYLLSQPKAIMVYLLRAVWPATLVFDYMEIPAIPPDTPPGEASRLFVQRVLPYALPVVVLLGASVYGLIRRRWWGFCGIAFFLILAPTSSILPIADLIVEHRMYLPLACVVTVVVAGVASLLGRLDAPRRTVIGVGLVALATLALGARTMVRNVDYDTRVSIWQTVTRQRPLNPRGWHNLGAAYYDDGDLQLAMAAYEQVIAIFPHHAPAINGIGNVWLDAGRPENALPLLRRAAELKPDDAAYQRELGRCLIAVGDLDEGAATLQRAIDLDPDYAQAYSDLGTVRGIQGRDDEAIALFERALAIDPTLIPALSNLMTAYEKQQRYAEAADVARRALALAESMSPRPADMIAAIRAKLAQYEQAPRAPASP